MFEDVRVFDGERCIDRTAVLIDDGTIVAIGPDLAVPASFARKPTLVVKSEGRVAPRGVVAPAGVAGCELAPYGDDPQQRRTARWRAMKVHDLH